MTTSQKQAARKFVERWTFRRGSEKGEDQQFWNSLLRDVLGVADVEQHIKYQVPVQLKDTTKFLDAWIPETRVLIEHKSRGVNLNASQSGHGGLTPYEQAVEYDNARSFDEKARWIVTCNFDEFRIYDRVKPLAPPMKMGLGDLPKEAHRLAFLVNPKEKAIDRELEISVQAGRIVGEIYDALLKQYDVSHAESQRGREFGEKVSEVKLAALNRLCVRLVFCLYAEDADIFPKDCFKRLVEATPAPFLRERLIRLFQVLDTPLDSRDIYLEPELCVFPYTNGGLFKTGGPRFVAATDGTKPVPPAFDDIPPLTEEIRKLLIGASQFDWRDITPTIFGALFESTLNPVTRRAGGMVYTSVENIHKVIDPLFLSALEKRFEDICQCENVANTNANSQLETGNIGKWQQSHNFTLTPRQRRELLALQAEIASLTFLDPACGSGNFLTETYICLRRLENRIIAALQRGQRELWLDDGRAALCRGQGRDEADAAVPRHSQNPVKVSIAQFFGLEINDFAVAVAKTALWIAEAQMLRETAEILHREPDYLPLHDYANIVEGNALRLDWPRTNYIMGNPPFVGARMMAQGSGQKKDIEDLFGDIKDVQDLDYVCGWYKKAAAMDARCAFVSTNSISQGAQVPILWGDLIGKHGVTIDFAHQTFRWDNESTEKAAVHCVIVGFHAGGPRFVAAKDGTKPVPPKLLFTPTPIIVDNISPYLTPGPNDFVIAAKDAAHGLPKMNFGNQPRDGGHFILTPEERDAILAAEPDIARWIRLYIGAEEFIKGKRRYCFWLKGASPADIAHSKTLYARVAAVREFRLASKAKTTNGYAKVPHLFAQITQPDGVDYLIIPSVSSERRRYIPIGYVGAEVIASNAVQIVPNATLCHFGVLTSSVHMAWMRTVAGRLKSDYRYSKELVYNTFPWPERLLSLRGDSESRSSGEDSQITQNLQASNAPNSESNSVREKIEKAAQHILDVRAQYPDCSFAELYDENLMPTDLRAAHEANDRAVLAAYGLAANTPEPEIVTHLFKLYAVNRGAS